MYTYEIINTINNNNGILTRQQCVDICVNSPQFEKLYIDSDANEFNHFAMKCSDKDELIKFKIVD
jgi:hypothetical protein